MFSEAPEPGVGIADDAIVRSVLVQKRLCEMETARATWGEGVHRGFSARASGEEQVIAYFSLFLRQAFWFFITHNSQ